MTDRRNKNDDAAQTDAFAGTLKDSARQIWLAGMGALARAQEEGGKLFEALAKEGAALQEKVPPQAQERFARTRSRMADMAADLSSKASDRFEGIFDDRVAKALDRLDVPLASEVDALRARIDELERAVAALAARSNARRRSSTRGEGTAPTVPPQDE